ncbi:MAG: cystathionine beta-lyase [Maricaulaceae bacterium]
MADHPADRATRLVHSGRAPGSRVVNPPVERGSTVLLPDAEALYGPGRTYGRRGLAVQDALRAALAELEGGIGCELAPSGLGAMTLAVLALTRAGGHVLASDSLYGPVRAFCAKFMNRFGVETEFFPPRAGADLAERFRETTQLVILESPGSLSFEVQDLPLLTELARARGALSLVDNTWGAGVGLKPLDLGADVSMQALTKYVGGHSDLLMGSLVARDKAVADKLERASRLMGLSVSPDDASLALRGLRTLDVRWRQHEAAGLELAAWLEARTEVARVLHPGLPSHPDHGLWRRDFTGAAGLFGVILHPASPAALDRFFAALSLFSLGFSWGGFESLVIPCDPQIHRTPEPWAAEGPLLRFWIGLEAVEDLKADLARGFGALHAA